MISTASAAEIERFSALADAWWDPRGQFRPLHDLNPVRIDYIRDRAIAHFHLSGEDPTPLGGLRVLDVGCGGGLVAESLARLGASVTGIDASDTAIRVAQVHAGQHGLDIDYRCTVPEALAAAEPAAYDLVVSMEVVEHVTDVNAFVGACAALLRPGGGLAIATLNRTIRSLLVAKVGAEYVLRLLPIGTHDWRRFIRPSELARTLRRNGIDLLHLRGMAFQPWSGRWTLSRDPSINYIGFGTLGANRPGSA
jgi:2-polyprenyl-6-hydroxyphenyl methylase/3-demethylubiquinone-9 3-methyltransferase